MRDAALTMIDIARLELSFERRNDRTVLAHCHQRAPLMVQRPFYPEGAGVCHVVALHNGGGLVAGDVLAWDVALAPGAQAALTTASAGKIYRSQGPETRQGMAFRLERDAVLEWVPQETLVFEGARFRQEARVDLAQGARLLSWEVVRFGRTARQERFTRGDWRSHVEVWRGGAPLWIDRQWLPGSEAAWHSPHGLAGRPVAGALVWVGEAVPAALVAEVRAAGEGLEGACGVAHLPEGLICRYRGDSTREAQAWFEAVRRRVRAHAGRPAGALPRVWHPVGGVHGQPASDSIQ